MSDHFAAFARDWAFLGPPMRPAPGDVAVMQAQIDADQPARGLILGVTPELVACRWPGIAVAVDHSEAMIRAMGPPRTVRADWLALPFRTGSMDLVVGDGCLALLDRAARARLFAEIKRVLVPGGALALRSFVLPACPETVEDIARAVTAGEVPSVTALKMRLFAAVDRDGSYLPDVWAAWRTIPRPPSGPRWTDGHVATIEVYRDRPVRYYLPPLAALVDEFAAAYATVSVVYGEESVEQFPTIIAR